MRTAPASPRWSRSFFSGGWESTAITVSAAAEGLQVIKSPYSDGNSAVTVGNALTATIVPFDAASLAKYREAALRFVPATSKDVRIRQEVNQPLDIFDWTDYRFPVASTPGGLPAQQEITFLNLQPGQQIVLIATAYDADFTEFTQRTYNLIRSWHPLTAADENPPPFN